MRPVITVGTEEYLVGSYIEQNLKELNVWVPTKDSGVDMLVSDQYNRKTLGLEIKQSRDYTAAHFTKKAKLKVVTAGSWTFQEDKLEESKADYLVLIFHPFDDRGMNYLIIRPAYFLTRLKKLNGKSESYQCNMIITTHGKCWEEKGLTKLEQLLVANNTFRSHERDFTRYANVWAPIGRLKRGI